MPRQHAVILLILAALPGPARADEPPAYEVYAVRYARMPGFPVAELVKGADPGRKLDIAMTVWVLKGPGGRTVLVDSGFHREKYVKANGENVADFTRPDEAIGRLGIRPDQVTDIVITHMHWDHVGGIDLFPKARIWIQKDEFAYYTGAAWQRGGRRGGIDPEDVLELVRRNTRGLVTLVDGDAKEILPGITVYTGGRHTFASQYVGVNTKAGRAVIASDNLYLYENLDRHAPIAQTFDAASNLAAQDRMKQLAASPRLIVPGHDPEVFVRFPKPGDGVARVE